MTSAIAVCKEILRIGHERGIDNMSPLKLIKLTHICQGFHLAIYNEPFFDEPIEAWRHGPVIRSVYDEVKRYGRKPIYWRHFEDVAETVDEKGKEIVDMVMQIYGERHATVLSVLTHHMGTPWYLVRKKMLTKDGVIPHFLIKEHYVNDIIKPDEDE